MRTSSSRSARRLLLALCLGILSARAQLSITEFMAADQAVLADEDNEYSDWIELQNTGATTVNLEGWSLTDRADEPGKWKFPRLDLAPQRYLVVFASGKNRTNAAGRLHTSFSLDAKGEYLALVKPDGVTRTSEFTPSFPAQKDGYSYGLSQGQPFYFATPTPGAANGAGFSGFVDNIKFSQSRGFYSTPFDLSLSTETPNASIRYTTNGTLPALTNGFVYAGPLPIAGTATVRAAAFRAGDQPSPVETHTYLFLDDVLRQSTNGAPPPGWPSSWGSNVRDYGMDPDVVNSPAYRDTIKDDLKTLPLFSIVMNLADLFNASTGIYANAGQDGRTWERPCSVELIYPDGTKGFQANAGIRIRGGFSRSSDNPKHAFRLFFRDEYGVAKLRYPLFGDSGADRFDAIDLRTFQNYSWSFQNDSRGIFLRDQFSRDTQLDMGHQGERGDFYHLYINGQYWGLYNTCERPEASFGETYYGGKKEDYDVVKVEAGAYTVNATDGTMAAWTRLYNQAKAGFASDAAYQRVQGRNPDGSRNPDYENLIDLDNLIDYMLVIFYGGNLDAPISNFLGNTSPNNWYGMRDRLGSDGFRFFAHDSEHTLLSVTENRLGFYTAGDSSVTKSSPQWIFQKLTANPEFRIRLADRIQRYFFNDGQLTPAACQARLLRRKNEIDRAVVGESARWGDAKRATPFTRNVEWMAEINRVLNSYMPQRSTTVLNQLKTKGLFPTTVAPSFSQHGGNVPPGYALSMSAPSGQLYYTLDGSDPRLPGGAVSPGARSYAQALPLQESLTVKARALAGTNWSALNEASFVLIQTFTNLLITEIMYHPGGESPDADDQEFIELKNVSGVELDLSGVRFTNGVRFVFPNGTRLAPGQFKVIAANESAFTNRYPGVRLDGVYSGRLANGGETLSLVHAAGGLIQQVRFSDELPWPPTADGGGFSLVPVNPNLNPDPLLPANWRASSAPGGSPGRDDPNLSLPTVWITEILAHTDAPQLDAIELHNPTQTPADVSGWFLTDQRSTPKKFRIPPGTLIPAGGYRVFTETDFNAAPGSAASFNLNSHGEEVYLFSASLGGDLTGYSDGFSFEAAPNGVSFGRYLISTGEIQYPPQRSVTLGAANAGPQVGPVVINEIQFDPSPTGDEFIELRNLSASAIRLYDPLFPTNTWRLNGVDFTFPRGLEIPAHGYLLLVASDPASFRLRYGVPEAVGILGPYPGALQNNGERLQLQWPDAPELGTNGVATVAYVTMDEVRYDRSAPWPTTASGTGNSLERIDATGYGNDPANWRASFGSPSPGRDNNGNRPPRVNAGVDLQIGTAALPWTTALNGSVADDGLPRPPGQLTIEWQLIAGPTTVTFATPTQTSTQATFRSAGDYRIRLRAFDGEVESVDELMVRITREPVVQTLISSKASWKYLDTGADLGTAWQAPDYSDSAWKVGAAQLGYGDGDEATVVGFGPNSGNKYVTTYFRRSFNLSGAKSVTRLQGRLLRDDGAVVYLNGSEVFRSNLPEETITASTYASEVASGDDETVNFYEHDLDPAVLREGNNVVAVEVHQVNASSTDLSFDFELIATSNPSNEPPAVNAGPDLAVSLPNSAALKGQVSDDGQPNPPGKTTLLWTVTSGPGEVRFENISATNTLARFSLPGSYVLRLTAADGELSVADELTVTVSLESYADWRSRYFTAAEIANQPEISGDSADPDADGLSNRQEYDAATHPRDANSVMRLGPIRFEPGEPRTLQLEFAVPAYRAYELQRREQISSGAWFSITNVGLADAPREVQVVDPAKAGASQQVYRLFAPRQP